MTNQLLPTQTDLIILLASLIVIYFQIREMGLRLWQASLPAKLKRQIIVLLNGSANWGNLATALGLAIGNAFKEICKYALRHPGQIIVDLWFIQEFNLITERWPMLLG